MIVLKSMNFSKLVDDDEALYNDFLEMFSPILFSIHQHKKISDKLSFAMHKMNDFVLRKK